MARKKFKIKYKKLLLFLLFFILTILFLILLFNLRITNIYVSGNNYFSDQYIIESGNLENYPKAILTFSKSIESKLKNNQYIKDASVKKRFLNIYIDVLENRPLFYDDKNGKTILSDGTSVLELYNVPILTSHIDSNIYEEFLDKFSNINIDVFNSISEFSYVPTDVDKELFLFIMNDGNYIYINLSKFDRINQYFDMIVNFNNRKGILYLDSGEYFKIFDN